MIPKGSIAPDGRTQRTNAAIVRLPGRGRVNATRVGAWDEEMGVIDLPDYTSVSDGDSQPFDLVISFAMSDEETNNYMAEWRANAKNLVAGYKKQITVMYPMDKAGSVGKTFNMHGCHPRKRGVPEIVMGPRGESLNMTWTLRVNEAVDA